MGRQKGQCGAAKPGVPLSVSAWPWCPLDPGIPAGVTSAEDGHEMWLLPTRAWLSPSKEPGLGWLEVTTAPRPHFVSKFLVTFEES